MTQPPVLALSCGWQVGGLRPDTELKGQQIAFVLGYIITCSHSKLFTKFGLIWWLDPWNILKLELF